MTSSPLDGNWWIYWKGPNHYKEEYAYFLSRIDEVNATEDKVSCFTHSNTSYSYDNVFKNIVNALETDNVTIAEESAQLAEYIHRYD